MAPLPGKRGRIAAGAGLTVMHRNAASIDALTGCLLRHVDSTGRTVRELDTRLEWTQALADIFAIRFTDSRPAAASSCGARCAWLMSSGWPARPPAAPPEPVIPGRFAVRGCTSSN